MVTILVFFFFFVITKNIYIFFLTLESKTTWVLKIKMNCNLPLALWRFYSRLLVSVVSNNNLSYNVLLFLESPKNFFPSYLLQSVVSTDGTTQSIWGLMSLSKENVQLLAPQIFLPHHDLPSFCWTPVSHMLEPLNSLKCSLTPLLKFFLFFYILAEFLSILFQFINSLFNCVRSKAHIIY